MKRERERDIYIDIDMFKQREIHHGIVPPQQSINANENTGRTARPAV